MGAEALSVEWEFDSLPTRISAVYNFLSFLVCFHCNLLLLELINK